MRKGGGRWPVSAVTELPRAPGWCICMCVCVEMDKSVRGCVSMCMKRGQGRRLLLIAGFPQLAEYTGLV